MSRKDEKTSQIICAAMQELLDKGLKAASMQNIAVVASVSKRTLYKYFPCKEDLFNSLIEELISGIYQFQELKYESEKSVELQLAQIIDWKIQLLTSEEFINLSKIVGGEFLKGRRLNPEQLVKMNESESYFLKWVQDAQSAGAIKSNEAPTMIANQFHSVLKGQIFYPILFGFVEKELIDYDLIKKQTIEFFVKCFC